MLVSLLKRLKRGTEYLNYGRDIISAWGSEALRNVSEPKVLDIGVGSGADLLRIAERLGFRPDMHGVDSHESYLAMAMDKGIQGVRLNIEADELPFPDGYFHLVIANQVLEHIKEIFWILSEVGRVLQPGGHFIVGVPNLASLHNRLGLLFGLQPTSINLLSAHVRGFSKGNAMALFSTGGFFQIVGFKGSNFYPFPPAVAKPLASLLPSMAVSNFYLLRRTDKPGRFLDYLAANFLETPFYTGPRRDV